MHIFTEVFLLLLWIYTVIDMTLSLGLKQEMEFTFLLSAGKTECFFQPTLRGDTVEVEYQVIAGSGLDVGFTLVSPDGYRVVSEFRKSDGIHMVDVTEDGDYRICFDNSFSKMAVKLVYFEVILNSQSNTRVEWGDVGKDSLVEEQLEDFRASLESVHRHLERSRQVQAALRTFEARDRYLLEDNLWRVSFWSCLTLMVMLTVAVTQIYTLKRLFEDKPARTAKA